MHWGSGCGSVGIAVASDTRDPRFETSHWRNFINLFTINHRNKENEAGNGLLKKVCALAKQPTSLLGLE